MPLEQQHSHAYILYYDLHVSMCSQIDDSLWFELQNSVWAKLVKESLKTTLKQELEALCR